MAIRVTKIFYVYSDFHLTAESKPRLLGLALKPKPIAPRLHMRQLHVFSSSLNGSLGCGRLFSISQTDTLVPCRPICSLRYIWRVLSKDWVWGFPVIFFFEPRKSGVHIAQED